MEKHVVLTGKQENFSCFQPTKANLKSLLRLNQINGKGCGWSGMNNPYSYGRIGWPVVAVVAGSSGPDTERYNGKK